MEDLGETEQVLGMRITLVHDAVLFDQQRYIDEAVDDIRTVSQVGKWSVILCTWPDIAYAINSDSSFSSNPGEAHWTAAKRILCYLKETKLMGLIYVNQDDQALKGFSDADWGTSPNQDHQSLAMYSSSLDDRRRGVVTSNQ